MEYVLKELACEKDFAGKRVLVTAGPTREAIDPVRFLSNHSSGKMGYALAKAAMLRGAEVTLVTGPTALPVPLFVRTVAVTSAEEMYQALMQEAPGQDVIIKAAAVADYRPQEVAEEKVKKQQGDLKLPLARTKDILQTLGAAKAAGEIHAYLCGFSMETQELLANSRKKLEKKKVDLIVANHLKTEGAGFGTDTNVLTLIGPQREQQLEKMSKEAAAHRVLDEILRDL